MGNRAKSNNQTPTRLGRSICLSNIIAVSIICSIKSPGRTILDPKHPAARTCHTHQTPPTILCPISSSHMSMPLQMRSIAPSNSPVLPLPARNLSRKIVANLSNAAWDLLQDRNLQLEKQGILGFRGERWSICCLFPEDGHLTTKIRTAQVPRLVHLPEEVLGWSYESSRGKVRN